MSIVEFLSQPLWQRLGLTLVHFLWQGLAVAVLAGAFVRVFRLKHGNARYAAYLLAFIAMIVCPVVTFTAIDIPISPNTELVTGAESTEVIETSSYTALSAGDILAEAATSSPAMPTLADSIPLGQRISDWLNVSMPWVLVIWMVGVIVLSVRLVMGFVGVYRWRHHLEPLPERLAQRIASLSDGLGMRNFSCVFISPAVLQAMAVGYLRPMVLLPAAMVTQMQPEMLEAVIAHELAHIRRLDLWVNLAQRVTETLLFYHPAVWWLSNCLRSERELCCDELAVKATGERITYATTLESVGRSRFMAKPPILATGLGQNNKPTLGRVRHILGLRPTQRNCPFWLAGVIAVLFLAAIAILTTLALTNQSDEKLMDFESVVVEGIRANRDKFKCGYLAWSSKQITTRFADSGRPATELAGQYELWWDGKKMATKYVRDQVYKDPEGNFRVEKQQGGNSYDGGVLSRKPDFRSGNWLGPRITRWRGLGSQDWLIRQDSKQESISKDWSVVDNNGVKLIRAITRNMNEKARDYGAYSIRDYDPSKGYGLVNEEWYNPDGSPRLKHTVKMLEVIPGGWFPVEVDFKSFAITDGRVYSHQNYALDIERCSFNDKSALPDRVFKWAVDKQLKYQEKLQKYLAMELRGLSDVKEAAKADKVKRGAREAIEKFVASAMAGDLEKAGKYAHPDRLPANQIADITEIAKGQNLWIMAVVADDFSAIAVSSVILSDHDRIGPLVFFLDRVPLDGRDNWWVHDIDMETPDGAEVELKQFLEKHPEAEKIPSEKKPTVQVEGEENIAEAARLTSSFTTEDILKIWRDQERKLHDIYIDFNFDETLKDKRGSVVASKRENIMYMSKGNLFRTRKQVFIPKDSNNVSNDWELSADGTREYYYDRPDYGIVKNSLPEHAAIRHTWVIHYLSCVYRMPRKKGNIGHECNLIGALEEAKNIEVTEELFEGRKAVVLNRPNYSKIYLDPMRNFAVLGSEATGDLTFKCRNSNFVEVAEGIWMPLQTKRTFKQGSNLVIRKTKVNKLKINNNFTKEDFRIKFEPGTTVHDREMNLTKRIETNPYAQVEVEKPDGAEGELKQFLEKHPKAQKVPQENKPAVQVNNKISTVQKSFPLTAEDKTQVGETK